MCVSLACFQGSVAFLHRLVDGSLLECDLANLLEGVVTNLLLHGFELGHVAEIALLHLFLNAFQDWTLLERVELLLTGHTHGTSGRIQDSLKGNKISVLLLAPIKDFGLGSY